MLLSRAWQIWKVENRPRIWLPCIIASVFTAEGLLKYASDLIIEDGLVKRNRQQCNIRKGLKGPPAECLLVASTVLIQIKLSLRLYSGDALSSKHNMSSMKIIIPLHFISLKKDSKQCCDTTTPESIHTKDESKRGSAFAFIFGVNWPVQWM